MAQSLPAPSPLDGPVAKVTAKSLAAGAGHLLVVTDKGELFARGSNSHGQLGLARLWVSTAGVGVGLEALEPAPEEDERNFVKILSELLAYFSLLLHPI